MTDRTNVITVSQENLDWINSNVPGKSKRARLENLVLFYKTNGGPRKTDPEAPMTTTTTKGAEA